MIADILVRIADLRRSLDALAPEAGGWGVSASLLAAAHDGALAVLRDLVNACPNPKGAMDVPADRSAWCLDRCGDARVCTLERITMDIAFVAGSLDRVESDPTWIGAYLPQAAERLDAILADRQALESKLPSADDPLSCPGGLARATRTPIGATD